MKNFKAIFLLAICFIVCTVFVSACGSSDSKAVSDSASSKAEERAAAREARKKERESKKEKSDSSSKSADKDEASDSKSADKDKASDSKSADKDKVSDTSNDAEMVLVYSENQVEGYPTVLGAEKFRDIVEEETNGRIKIDVRPNSQVGSEEGVVKMLQEGAEFEGNQVAFLRVSLAPLITASNYQKLNVLQLPYLYRDKEHMRSVLNSDIGEVFLNELAEDNTGLRGLAWFDSGARNFYNSKREIKSPDDLKGLTIRVMKSDMMFRLVELLGANPVSTSYEEVLGALESGEIDGAENNWPSYMSKEHYKFAPYYSIDEHNRIPEMVVISDKIWNSLSEDDQDIIKRAAQLGAEVEWEEWAAQEKEYEKQAKKEGCTITEVKDVTPFQEAVKPLYDEFASDYKDVIEDIQNYKE